MSGFHIPDGLVGRVLSLGFEYWVVVEEGSQGARSAYNEYRVNVSKGNMFVNSVFHVFGVPGLNKAVTMFRYTDSKMIGVLLDEDSSNMLYHAGDERWDYPNTEDGMVAAVSKVDELTRHGPAGVLVRWAMKEVV